MKHSVSFKYALEGLKYAFSSQPNFKIHSLVAILVTLAGIVFKISHLEWLILLFTISLVLVAEMINTSLESMTDLIETKHHQNAKIAKDVAAGMVLLAATSAVIIGLTIFVPKFYSLLAISH